PEYDLTTFAESTNPTPRTANLPTEANRRYYPDQTSFIVVDDHVPGDPATPETGVVIYNFSGDEALSGVPVTENANAYLMRYARWMVQEIGVDGFRVDAARHVYPFVHDYFDRAVFRADERPLLDGSARHVFSFLESYTGDQAQLQTFVAKDLDPADPSTVGGNRDVLDLPLFFAFEDNLTDNGYNNNWHNIIDASQDVYDDGLANNGSQSVAFVRSHDEEGAYLTNVAHAYMLTRPGNAAIYFNAREFNADPTLDERPFPHDGSRDALGGFYGDTVTRLVDIRNTHGRGDFLERWIDPTFSNYYAFEREGSMIVGLNSRHGGFGDWDERTIQTSFDEGTLLVELTGNAANTTIDTNEGTEWDIPEVITVGVGGEVTLRVPQNKNGAGVEHGLGYVVYGLATPEGTLSLSNVSATLSGDAATAANNPANRLTDVHVIAADSFDVQLDTVAVNLLGDPVLRDQQADGYFAVLRMDGGIDLNDQTGQFGNATNGVDYVTPGSLLYGFEDFTGANSPGYYSGTGAGQFLQSIDTTGLSEGRHYLTVRAFRHTDAASEPIYTDFKKVIYIDRAAPTVALAETRDSGGGAFELIVESTDQTAQSVQVLLDLPASLTDAEVIALSGSAIDASAIDLNLFNAALSGIATGNHVYSVIATEESGNGSVTRYVGQSLSGSGAGLGDLTGDGLFTVDDVNDFATIYNSGNTQFHAAADHDGDGLVDEVDVTLFGDRLNAVGATNDVLSAYNLLFGEAPVFADQSFNLAENSAVDTLVGTLAATDPDFDPITYSIATGVDGDSDGNEAFRIDGNTLLVNDAGDLDFETSASLLITAEATDGTFIDSATITVTLTDLNESPELSDQVLSLAENSADATVVAVLAGSDPDGDLLNYSITNGFDGDTDGNEAFRIEAGNLVVNDADDLDYETNPSIAITLEASDTLLEDSALFTIQLTDLNEFAPTFADQSFSLSEHASAGTSIGILTASDADGSSLSFSITSGVDTDGDGTPAVRIEGNELLVNDAGDLDFESAAAHLFTLEANDGEFTTSAVITLHLTDINDAPLWDDEWLSLQENSAVDTLVGTLSATDPDGDSLSYTILTNDDADGDSVGTFYLSGNQLLLADADDVNFESGPVRPITVQVTDGTLAANATVTVMLSDVNETPTFADQSFSLPENSADGTVVGTFVASDPDANSLSFSISGNFDGDSDGNNAFRIDDYDL
ncbi:MAG TPA: cadherin domain-containing protein, partial [Pirellulales bacterium]|nr:cadherin domain-containing protein [Pirellulales bacterium]